MLADEPCFDSVHRLVKQVPRDRQPRVRERFAASLVVLSVMAAACGSPNASTDVSPAPEVSTTNSPGPTATRQASDSPAVASNVSTTIPPAPTITGQGSDSPSVASKAVRWDYVTLGDSFTGWATWPEMYSLIIEEDMGVEVVLHDEAVTRQSAAGALERLRSDQRVRDLVSQAEVITIGIVIGELPGPMTSYARDGDCGGEDNQDCIRAAIAGIEADWVAVLDELVALRSPNDAIITTLTKGAFPAETLCEWGTDCWEVLAGYLVDLFEFAGESAQLRGIRIADTMAALHAPGVFEAPVNRDYVKSDLLHLSEEGDFVVADVLRSLGYS